MAIHVSPVQIPQSPLAAEECRPYLKEFIHWFHAFLHQVSDNPHDEDRYGTPLFEVPLIEHLRGTLAEVEELQHFELVGDRIGEASAASLREYGLEGRQLIWKISNINHWLIRFISERTSALFERLLTSIDALLKSLLGAAGVGDALEELKEAVLNSTALATE